MYNLLKIEKEKNILLPEVYKIFYKNCSFKIPDYLIGTDLLNNCPDLHKDAICLLEEDEVKNFLEEDDFVFMMHQGYMFWYFKADGNPDPIVYGYHERKLIPDNFGNFSDFIKESLKLRRKT